MVRIEYGLVVVLLAQTLVVVVVHTQEFLVVSCSRGCGENSGRGGCHITSQLPDQPNQYHGQPWQWIASEMYLAT